MTTGSPTQTKSNWTTPVSENKKMKGYLKDLAKVVKSVKGFKPLDVYKRRGFVGGNSLRADVLVISSEDDQNKYNFQVLEASVEFSKYCSVNIYGSVLDSDDNCLAYASLTLGPVRFSLGLCSIKYILETTNE